MRTYIKYMMAIYMAIYFVFNGAFLHTHIIEGENISHSHFFAGKQHTASAAQLIYQFNTASTIVAEEIALPVCEFSEIVTCYLNVEQDAIPGNASIITLRGPPVC